MAESDSFLEKLFNVTDGIEGTDIILYNGPIDRNGYVKITKACRKTLPPRNVLLVLATYGGDPDAAYRIARALRHNYHELTILIPRECKSAGTLLAIGATKLVICDMGELGPLDVQLRKHDEMFESSSALDYYQALTGLQSFTKNAFKDYLLDIKSSCGITAKTAADFSAALTTGLFSSIFQQLDPIKLGEVQRAVQIAEKYGERLNSYDKPMSDDALSKLIAGYPSHGFVIDRKEAKTLFNNVDSPDENELKIASLFIERLPPRSYSNVVLNISQMKELRKLPSDEASEPREDANDEKSQNSRSTKRKSAKSRKSDAGGTQESGQSDANPNAEQ
ncbi:SDH family Clp fold serine proteinase [Pectobacterium brasiliense]|uniref:SDH family Clp fold serine proteinase n=1 Tax=Pectobacterium brasiliense TaxID=180957 RepID=UPI002A83F3D5|nr:SppA protein [Pectobacterium brasiliense]MDY4380941.1 SppA protein [Pectobacterium brasiliense]